MKQRAAILLFLVYFHAVLNLGVSLHFCGGELVSVQSLLLSKAHCSPSSCPMGMENCKDEVLACHADSHTLQTGVPSLLTLEGKSTACPVHDIDPALSPIRPATGSWQHQSDHYACSCRHVLALIHTLRI